MSKELFGTVVVVGLMVVVVPSAFLGDKPRWALLLKLKAKCTTSWRLLLREDFFESRMLLYCPLKVQVEDGRVVKHDE